ncbi:MAG: type II toxin-antitoxin system VapC family toxin [Methanobrevibacter sp.]|uniref:type II toxin-antitoxin system VapC family toxin n=1 Tax=Methanobrevibacter sp. TaxID=66852 RepID=UPI0026E1094D|nr:type II toxin-antitoxin system VapC family toxin [Methanobrevibacter sp.]MDO5849501.1 type II toxin-antitoxin system VapC family toxin [Methanobrevibacter sp.]
MIGLFYTNSAIHEKALELQDIIKKEDNNKLINNIVLCETVNRLSQLLNKPNSTLLKKFLRENRVYYLKKQDYIDAYRKTCHYNYSINFNDCCIHQTMFNYNITSIASFDSDFDKFRNINRFYVP